MSNPILTICAWCEQALPGVIVSHGICEHCAADLEAALGDEGARVDAASDWARDEAGLGGVA